MPMGRPEIQIDMAELASLMRLMPTLKDCAAFYKCSEDTIERRIKAAHDLTFAEFRDQNMVHTRLKLIRTALQKADSGDNVMLIFCLKNVCDWKDKRETDVSFGKKSVAEIVAEAERELADGGEPSANSED